ncbi:hypothetical protein [Shewanella sp.]|uniref:hypothetical protein n=1 Tax=Shewanella sp. TaxID=50422 RepID=UPI004048CDF0
MEKMFGSEPKPSAQRMSLGQFAEPYIAKTATLRDFKVQDYVSVQVLGTVLIDDKEVPTPVEVFFKKRRDADMTIKCQMKMKDKSTFSIAIFDTFFTIDRESQDRSHGVFVLTPRQDSEFGDSPYLQGVLVEAALVDLINSMSSPAHERRVQLDSAKLFLDLKGRLSQLEGQVYERSQEDLEVLDDAYSSRGHDPKISDKLPVSSPLKRNSREEGVVRSRRTLLFVTSGLSLLVLLFFVQSYKNETAPVAVNQSAASVPSTESRSGVSTRPRPPVADKWVGYHIGEIGSQVYLDAEDVLHVSGPLSAEVGEKIIESLHEGVRSLEFDVQGGELGQTIRVAEMLKTYAKPIKINACSGVCVILPLTLPNQLHANAGVVSFRRDPIFSDSEYSLLIQYLKKQGVTERLLALVKEGKQSLSVHELSR